MKFRFLVALMAALSMLSLPSVANAGDRGKPADRVWMSGSNADAIITELQAGSEVCVGSKKNHGCARINPFTGEALIQDVSRPIGANKNVVVNTIVAVGSDGAVIRNEAGVVLARFQVGSENANWQSTMQNAIGNLIPAVGNGLGAAVVQAVASPCGGSGGCGTGVTNIVSASSGSASSANANLTAALAGGGCPSGTCPAPTNPNHPQN